MVRFVTTQSSEALFGPRPTNSARGIGSGGKRPGMRQRWPRTTGSGSRCPPDEGFGQLNGGPVSSRNAQLYPGGPAPRAAANPRNVS